jgi:hypothetical protein
VSSGVREMHRTEYKEKKRNTVIYSANCLFSFPLFLRASCIPSLLSFLFLSFSSGRVVFIYPPGELYSFFTVFSLSLFFLRASCIHLSSGRVVFIYPLGELYSFFTVFSLSLFFLRASCIHLSSGRVVFIQPGQFYRNGCSFT